MTNLRLRILPLVIFLAGMASMSLQLIGSRLLAPHFGSSIFIWTSLIGVMLGFMALGNFIGGRLADARPQTDLLFWILVLLSASISLVAMVGAWSLGLFVEIESLRTGMVLGSVALFAIPCTLFGMVLPTAIRLRMNAVTDSGANIGSLSAISMMGNIAGTFATGFWLIALVGSRSLLAWLALLVLILAATMGLTLGRARNTDWYQSGRNPAANPTTKAAALIVAAALVAGAFIWHPPAANLQGMRVFDTLYEIYLVGEQNVASADPEVGARPVRFLANSPRAWESAVYADTLEPHYFSYYAFYDLAAEVAAVHSAGDPNSLMIGGGAFVYPHFFFDQFPQAHMDVVEIDAALVQEAEDHFGFVQPANMDIFLEDGRMLLNRAVSANRLAGAGAQMSYGPYDLVILDAFNSANSVPFQLTTRESMQHCADLLTDDGLLVMNLIASLRGEGSEFLASQYLTLQQVFQQVEVFKVTDRVILADVPRNVAIIASNSTSFDLRRSIEEANPELAQRRITPDMENAIILTDDFAPVDQMLMNVNRPQ